MKLSIFFFASVALLILSLLFNRFNPVQDISSSGRYGCTHCRLISDIKGGLEFTADHAKIDINGKTIDCGTRGNVPDTGINLTGKYQVLFDSMPDDEPAVTHCYRGIMAKDSKIINLTVSQVRLFGVTCSGACEMQGGEISNIEGVTDSPYAIGVQCSSVSGPCRINGVKFLNLYRQSAYNGDAAGEGVAVNFASDYAGGSLKNSIVRNDKVADATIGVFCGSGGAVCKLENNYFENIEEAAQGDRISFINNTAFLKERREDSSGFSANSGNMERNVAIGYETPYCWWYQQACHDKPDKNGTSIDNKIINPP